MYTHDNGGVGACGGGDDDGAHDGHVGDGGVESGTVPSDGQMVETNVAIQSTAGVPLDMEDVGDDAVAAYSIGSYDGGKVGAVGECCTVESVRQLIFHDGLLNGGSRGVADGQVQCGGAVASRGIGREVGGRLGAGCVGITPPGEVVAFVGVGIAGGGGPDIEVQCPQGVASVDGGVQHVAVESGVGSGVGGTLEGILLIIADGVGKGVVVNGKCVHPHNDGAVFSVRGCEQ